MLRKAIFFINLYLSGLTHALSKWGPQSQKHISFRELFFLHQLNASDKWENYLDIYDDVLHKFIGKSPNLLEIGVQNGGTLQIFKKYFKNAKIYGIDIDPKVCDQALGKDIKTFCFSALDVKRVEENFKDMQFDIIIDDGSHINSEVINTFLIFFSKLKPGGIYLIEDLHTSYWDGEFQGGYLKETTSIEYLKKFADLLNYYHIRDQEFFKNLPKEDYYVFEWLESITFYDSVAVIKKLNKQRTKSYDHVVVGKFEPVAPAIGFAKKYDYYYSK